MLRLISKVETRLEVRSETFVSACFYKYDFYFTAAVSLDSRISRIHIALRQSSASEIHDIYAWASLLDCLLCH